MLPNKAGSCSYWLAYSLPAVYVNTVFSIHLAVEIRIVM